MRFEVAFICGYALVLLALAWGLWRFGQVNNDPWSSRLFAAYRREGGELPRPNSSEWPHSEAPRFYTGLAVVAAAAATLLCAAEAVRHHAPAELGMLSAVAAVGLLSVARLARRFSAPAVIRG